ncbi:MAG: gluconate 2-dehydrogenase subunit 3 family protein [Acidobacteriaceae bacterium]|nr:gluconate 2-dehydrogenase subunit 3 family protein [Acidobacteriaceae bacterium]
MQREADRGTSTRRKLLRQLTRAAAAGTFQIFGQNPPPEQHHSEAPVTQQAASAYQYQYFDSEQLKVLDALGETIIPTDEHSPGARAAGVSEYIDAIVLDAPQPVQKLWNDGLRAVNHAARKRFGKNFPDCNAEEQTIVLETIAGDETGDSVRERFFRALKRATIDGYYTSKIGIHQELQYRGNEALREFVGCEHQEHA